MTAPHPPYGTGLLDLSREAEHFERTLQTALGANRNGDDFTRVRMSALGIPSIWAPMQVSHILPRPVQTPPRPLSPLWDIPSAAIGRRSRATSAPSGGPVVPRMYMAREDWEDILHYGTVDDETPARPFPVPDRERLRAEEAQRAREDAQVFAALDRAANPSALDIDPTRPAPMRLRIPTFEIGRDTPLSPEELARLPAGAPVSLEEQFILDGYHEQLRTEATQAVDEDILRTLTPHVPLDVLDMTGRFPMAMIPLDQGPTIRIDDILHRRFNIMDRERVTVPPLSPDKPTTLDQMEKTALEVIVRRTFWEVLLDDEYAY
jgi:hypothetical protein